MLDQNSFGDMGRSIGCLGIVAGSLFCLIGLGMVGFNAMSYSKMERAEGTTIKYERDRGISGPGPHVEFEVDGKPYVISGQIDFENGGRGIRIGEQVGVLYKPEDPSEGTLDLFLDKWFTAAMFTGVGFGVACIAIFMARSARQKTTE